MFVSFSKIQAGIIFFLLSLYALVERVEGSLHTRVFSCPIKLSGTLRRHVQTRHREEMRGEEVVFGGD